MNTRNLWIASLVGGLVSLVLVNAPFVNLINLALCAGFWVGPIVAVWLYRRMEGTLTFRQAVLTGLLASVIHAVLGMLLSPLGLAGAGGLFSTMRPFVSEQDVPAIETALTGLGAMVFNLIGMLFDVIFGLLGGLIGGAIFRTDRPVQNSGVHA